MNNEKNRAAGGTRAPSAVGLSHEFREYHEMSDFAVLQKFR